MHNRGEEISMARASEPDLELVIIDVELVAEGYRMSEVIRSDVTNDRGERIGTVDDVLVGRDDRVLSAVLQVGGFLGLGGRLVAVPYNSLVLDDAEGTLKIMLPGATKEELQKLPEFRYAD
jgi:hypothetical protein